MDNITAKPLDVETPSGKDDLSETMNEFVRKAVETEVNRLIGLEFDAVMGYGKSERAPEGQSDRRNGTYERVLSSRYGKITVNMPKARENAFTSPLAPKYSRRAFAASEAVIKLYQTGSTLSEIAELLDFIYGESYSPSQISRMTRAVEEDVREFAESRLPERAFALFVDGTFLPLKRGEYEKECLLMACAIMEDGTRMMLGYQIAAAESVPAYDSLLESLKKRGLASVEAVVCDGFPGLRECVSGHFPGARFQRCCVHKARNLASKVRKGDRKEITRGFMECVKKPTMKEAEEAIDAFVAKWSGTYGHISDWMGNRKEFLTHYCFPEPLRKLIYTSNAIESINRLFKSEMGKSRQFPNEGSMERRIVTVILRYNAKGTRCRGFESVIEYMSQKG